MKKLLPRSSAGFKGLLFLFGILISIGVLWYTQKLVDSLKEKSTEYIRFRIRLFEENINNPSQNSDVNFFFNEVIRRADYPIIYTDSRGIPQSWKNIDSRLDTLHFFTAEDSLALAAKLKEIATENTPIPITYNDAVLGYYYYGYPPEIYKLRSLPFVIFFIGIIFILLGYFGFTYIKKSEQRSIWVGLSKETAHQLGTPLSSLSGWVELLKSTPENTSEIVGEMENDLQRLNKIANRFSKIGSIPKLKERSLTELITSTVTYFNRRLPHLNRRIIITAEVTGELQAKINRDLFEWVLENLIKNAIDSIVDQSGEINIRVKEGNHHYIIDIRDSGKGIAAKHKTAIFKPGFSTKKRGWGLGLSLAKRIVEEYHSGKLLLVESRPGQGSTFRILLPKS
ncbi:MAG: sensor histidine kinase [Calditrichaeota bacterium]|nr:MAG: sensor histidine kinase [Calditrichota bacterium]